jgi:hypothetical protein
MVRELMAPLLFSRTVVSCNTVHHYFFASTIHAKPKLLALILGEATVSGTQSIGVR